MPLQATSGAASYDAFGGGVAAVPNYIEECFSTTLYTGNSSTQTITNGIDLAGEGGLIWFKRRDGAADHQVYDTVRGGSSAIFPNLTIAAQAYAQIDSFNANGLTINNSGAINSSGSTFASWTFRKAPKFFDVVTLNSSTTTYNHNLGSTPGCIIVKCTDASGANWVVWHRSFANTTNNYLSLNTTNAVDNFTNAWPSAPTSTQFSVNPSVWANGTTGIAYLFAHNAGGFGLSGTDNVISCGSYTGNGTTVGPDVNLGYEPQFLMVKNTSAAGSWFMWDSMRGITADGTTQNLAANSSSAENTSTSAMSINATGFSARSAVFSGSGSTYIYIAIRRGPMKVPTSGTSVFSPVARAGTGANATITSGFVTDLSISQIRSGSALGAPNGFFDRLRGATKDLSSNTTDAEITYSDSLTSFASNTGITVGADSASGAINYGGTNYGQWMFQRAPSFFDEVCYTGTGANLSVSHNLGTAPQLWIVKGRNGATDWMVGSSLLANTEYLFLNATLAKQTAGGTAMWNSTYPTASTLYLGTASSVNNSASDTYVAYLFATCAGVSKVGSYTGTGATKQVDCGFTGGARFVLIKRTDSTGSWYVWDVARGIVAGNDPYLLLNSTAAEVTNTDYVDTYSAGFEISSTAPAAINASGGTFIFLAIA